MQKKKKYKDILYCMILPSYIFLTIFSFFSGKNISATKATSHLEFFAAM